MMMRKLAVFIAKALEIFDQGHTDKTIVRLAILAVARQTLEVDLALP
jgi:hypothetical protein